MEQVKLTLGRSYKVHTSSRYESSNKNEHTLVLIDNDLYHKIYEAEVHEDYSCYWFRTMDGLVPYILCNDLPDYSYYFEYWD